MSTFYFDIDDLTDIKSKSFVDEKLKEILKPEYSGKFSVVLHNDPINGVDFVTKIIKEVFGYSASKSIWLMLKANFSGKSILWLGSHKEAIYKQNKMIAFGADPNMIEKGAEPLKVTVESNE